MDELNGRAILADEVGLGKTIEAGMILREYMDKGLVNNCLILVPASLGYQWTGELVNKFAIKQIYYNRKGRGWQFFDYQVASLDKAKRKRHAKYIMKKKYDMVIVDEAHKLKNRNTMNWKFVNNLRKKYCLLLTATPIQNDLKELYNLICILYPELYSDYKEFKEKYESGKYMAVNNTENNKSKLQEDLAKVMVRNYHKDTAMNLSERYIKQIFVNLSSVEKELYNKMTEYVHKEYNKRLGKNKTILNLLVYQKELCSSSYALQRTLAKKDNKDEQLLAIYELTKKVRYNAKVLETIKIIREKSVKIIIFTEYRATQEYIVNYLNYHGINTIMFNGGYSTGCKEWIKMLFKNKIDVLVSTEAGSQGLNLQFCNVIINYDLPWNPMKIEQRIGRIHRLGQTRDVYIYNLATEGTIEEKIIKVLYKKIFLFKEIIGDMNSIVMDSTLEANIMEIIGDAQDEKEMEKKFDNLLAELKD